VGPGLRAKQTHFYIGFTFAELLYPGFKIHLPLCIINKAPPHDDLSRSVSIAPPFLTLSLGGGESQLHTPTTLLPEIQPPVRILQETLTYI
jgi:hypothetical protein